MRFPVSCESSKAIFPHHTKEYPGVAGAEPAEFACSRSVARNILNRRGERTKTGTLYFHTMEQPLNIVRPPEFLDEAPQHIKRPCDYGLDTAVGNMEIQLGTIEAYNRLASMARQLKKKIDSGNSRAPLPCFLRSVSGA